MRWIRGATAAAVLALGVAYVATGVGHDLCIELTILVGRAAFFAVFAVTCHLLAG